MKVIDVQQVAGVAFTGGTSYRPVTAKDGLGFSVCKTVIPKGGPHRWHYQNHLEACYCVSGFGTLTNLATGEKFHIQPDMVYLLDKYDDHSFEAIQDVILISIFNPPLTGKEKHDEHGNYGV